MSQPTGPVWKIGPPEQPGWYLTEYRMRSGEWAGKPEIRHWYIFGGEVWYNLSGGHSPGPRADRDTSSDWSDCPDQVRTFGPVPDPRS